MLTGLEGTGIITLWAVAVVRAPQGVRSREQRPLWFAIVMIALAMSMHLDPVTTVLAHVGPSAHWIDLTTHLFSIVDGAAVLWFILQAARLQQHTVLVFGAAIAVMVALVLLDVGATPHNRNQIASSPDIPSVPDSYWWIFFAFHLTADTTCGLVCWRHSRRGSIPQSLRYGLRLFGTGILLATLLWVLKLGYLGTRSTLFDPLFSPITGAEALFIAAGAALPFLIQIRALLRYRRSHRGLALLWRDLAAAAPDVVLSPGNPLRAAAVPIQLRLYRRVIEIRDAMIVLRSYVAETTVDQVRRHVTAHAVPENQVDAHITACWLTAALRSRRMGQTPKAQSLKLTGGGAHDLTEEISYLLRIAAAYRSSVVHDYRALQSGPNH
ncbi:MAB_1171c family putative transporter [Streptomyces sp. GS7]|uniref:MAB_1171c family putative transporter n=1 Tax=Streptomyces sp. GS7 TaxID=2692234 RepID=UPI001F46A340|nr:MAB_1171c family putative transporter [Streptomyces sp. GS7]